MCLALLHFCPMSSASEQLSEPGAPCPCWGHSASLVVQRLPQLLPYDHGIRAAQGQCMSSGSQRFSPLPDGVQTAGAQGESFFLGSVSSSILPARFSSKGTNTGLGGWESRAGCSAGALGKVCPGIWRSEGEQGAQGIGKCSWPHPRCAPGGRCPSNSPCRERPLPVKAMPSGGEGSPPAQVLRKVSTTPPNTNAQEGVCLPAQEQQQKDLPGGGREGGGRLERRRREG